MQYHLRALSPGPWMDVNLWGCEWWSDRRVGARNAFASRKKILRHTMTVCQAIPKGVWSDTPIFLRWLGGRKEGKTRRKKLFSGNFDGSRVKVFIERNRNSSGLTFTWNFFRESFFRLCSFAGFLGQSTKEFRAAMHKKWLQKAPSWSKVGGATDQLNSYVSLGRVDPCSSSAPLSCPRTCSHLALDWLFGSLISNSSLSDKNVLYLHSLLLMESSVCAEVIILQVSHDIYLKLLLPCICRC